MCARHREKEGLYLHVYVLAGSADEEQPLDSVDEEDLFSAVQRDEKAQHVSGSFFHVDGVGLVDENVVRSNPWMLKTTQPPPFLSTLPHQNTGAGVVLSTAPVPPSPQPSPQPVAQPQSSHWALPSTGPAVLDGLTDAPHFNGLTVMIESFDAETNRYTVQLPFLDPGGTQLQTLQTHL